MIRQSSWLKGTSFDCWWETKCKLQFPMVALYSQPSTLISIQPDITLQDCPPKKRDIISRFSECPKTCFHSSVSSCNNQDSCPSGQMASAVFIEPQSPQRKEIWMNGWVNKTANGVVLLMGTFKPEQMNAKLPSMICLVCNKQLNT